MSDYFNLLPELLLLLASGFGFTYGILNCLKKRKALFGQIIVCAVGSLFYGQLFIVVRYLVGGGGEGFNVGMLGSLACYCFLFSANYGQMDSLIDGREPHLKKYRLAALLAPAVVILIYWLLVWPSGQVISMLVVYAVFFVMFAITSYYNLKHLIMPDVKMGILRSIRKYNLTVMVFTVCNILIVLAACYNIAWLRGAGLYMLCIPCMVIIPELLRGMEKWYQ